MTRILTRVSAGAMSASTLALTLVLLFHAEVPHWQGWAAILTVLLTVSVMAFLSGQRALLDAELRKIDEEFDREQAAERLLAQGSLTR